MSIIYDALNKAEDKGKKGKGRPPKSKKKIFVFVVFTVGLSLLLFYFGPLLKGFLLKHNLKKETGFLKRDIAVPAKTYSPDNYVLEGIIYDDEDSSAVINGTVLMLHGKIDDWEVIRITPASVELKNIKDNTILTLTL